MKAGNIGNRSVNFIITNSKITYTVNNQLVTLAVPDGLVRFEPGSSASTKYVNGRWVTKVGAGTNVNVFMTGLSYRLPFSYPGGIRNVKWSMDIEIDKDDVSLDWKWTAGVYSNFAGNEGLNVKPTDGLLSILNPLLGVANAGTPLNYTLNIVAGAMGSGLINITSTYSAVNSISCLNNSLMYARQLTQEPAGLQEQVGIGSTAITTVFPNPARDHFNVLIGGRKDDLATVRVYDITGRVLERYEKLSGSSTITVGNGLKSGTYFAEITINEDRKIFKLIKLK
jgi:hypothetical protein